MRCLRCLDLACEKKENQGVHIDEANGGWRRMNVYDGATWAM